MVVARPGMRAKVDKCDGEAIRRRGEQQPCGVLVGRGGLWVEGENEDRFFFQEEDGIRYLTVTGVQTCALPICVVISPASSTTPVNERRRFRALPRDRSRRHVEEDLQFSWEIVAGGGSLAGTVDQEVEYLARTEERRVGEESRSRGAADHLKKKKVFDGTPPLTFVHVQVKGLQSMSGTGIYPNVLSTNAFLFTLLASLSVLALVGLSAGVLTRL